MQRVQAAIRAWELNLRLDIQARANQQALGVSGGVKLTLQRSNDVSMQSQALGTPSASPVVPGARGSALPS